MTNDELKKKILGILDQATGDWYEKDDGLFAEGYTPEEGDNRFKAFIADALIKAGLKFDTVVSHTATFDLSQMERINKLESQAAEAEHRARVAERALRDELVQKAIRLGVTDIRPWYIQAINEAEKELAEEGKDENY